MTREGFPQQAERTNIDGLVSTAVGAPDGVTQPAGLAQSGHQCLAVPVDIREVMFLYEVGLRPRFDVLRQLTVGVVEKRPRQVIGVSHGATFWQRVSRGCTQHHYMNGHSLTRRLGNRKQSSSRKLRRPRRLRPAVRRAAQRTVRSESCPEIVFFVCSTLTGRTPPIVR